MSLQQSFISEIPLDVFSEIRELEALDSMDASASDLPNLNVVNAALRSRHIAEEAYQASLASFREILQGQGYEMEQLGSYEDTTYHMVHRSVDVKSLGYWGSPDERTNPLLVVAM